MNNVLQHIEHNENFDLAYRFVTETSENIFLTGKAGTGKTTFLKYLKEHCAKNIIVAAPTGVAAINAGGVTLHSLFQLPFHPFLPTKAGKDELLARFRFNKQRLQLLRKIELLVIDEISMVRADTMDAIDTILRAVRRNYHTPFGGVQLLCIGDLFQLPPVAKNDEWAVLNEYYTSPFFFDSLAIKEQMPLMIELTKIYRQKEDSFVRLLNKVRNNVMQPEDFEDLHQRYSPAFRPSPGEKYITLTSHNNQADQINFRELNKLLAPSFTYKAKIDGDFPEHMYPAEEELKLKEGAQVMFLKNDAVSRKYFNGKIGVIKLLEDDKIVVVSDGEEIVVGKETWENTRYSLNRGDGKLEQEVLGTFEQFALRLAWAITIHKSQGLTFEKVMIDAGAAFSSGQVYVALSRCTSLEGIVLLSKIHAPAIMSNDNVVKGQQTLTHKGSLAERFAGARMIFTQQQLSQIFLFEEINTAFNLLLHEMKQHADKFNNEGIDLVLKIHQQFLAYKQVGEKFLGHVYTMAKDEPVIEKNELLQKRISDAAKHFDARLSALLDAVKKHPLVTERKEASTPVDEALKDLALTVYTTHYYLQYCRQSFELNAYLKHKLAFAQPRFSITSYASGKKQNFSGMANAELFETLKRWRDVVFEETALPIYMIANAETLKALSTFLPLNKKDLAKIKGFGKAKVDKYGDDIIEIISDYCEKYSLETNMHANTGEEKKEKTITEKVSTKADTKMVSFDLYKQGKSIAAIAEERKFTVQTIEGHLSHFIESGELSVNEFLPDEKQQRIIRIYHQNKEAGLTQMKEQLPDISFGELRMMMAAIKYGEM
ncbi:MAG: helix-turn-helix domain-containing protein [Chitinophagaceae bacterium]|nr:helix-turn-helix domain-containing protein [Chitinophagaceae bacterium]